MTDSQGERPTGAPDVFKIPKLKRRPGMRGDKRRYRCGSCRKVVWTTRPIAVTRCRACKRGTMRPYWSKP